jgi:hypothetical protein
MKLFLSFLLLFTITKASSQGCFGCTEQEVKDYLDCTPEVKYTDHGFKVFTCNLDDYSVQYFLKENKCLAYSIIIFSTKLLNSYIEELNRDMVIVSNTEWKSYSAKGVIEIVLKYTPSRGSETPYFTYTLSN